ncbi:hypothetical protein BO78DRAFT_322214 [Aspergillus sclerotiicarbonarius CBS 121057]|uniref:Uncharacterized protein n=1 Tax=Aspergillus sclerotiicarbonarius (strain CBS 121057 / IBT 28362) TaxID=1448318 RepID=A0A319E6D7_ASPSB|nr:hypothetical protein BO78DRAFT_322214 [Aspergillus sclerotiicarbonarius CBS 121057]
MELILLIFLLAASINVAHCSWVTGPFEAIFFYYTYQIDAAAAARAAEDGIAYTATIGADCMNQDCTLEEFIRSIMNEDFVASLTPTELGESTSPDVYATAENIDEYWNYNSRNLRANKIITNPPRGFAKLVTAVANKIQRARAVVPSADLVDKALVALKWAQAARLSELVIQNGEIAGDKALAFQERFPWATLDCKQRELDIDDTVSPSLKIVYSDLDYAKMAVYTSGNDFATAAENLRGFLGWAETSPTDGGYQMHQNLVTAYQRSVARLQSGCS